MRKLNEPEVREQCQIEITNKFAALENLSGDEDVDRTWENIKENIKTLAKESLGLHELKQNKPWFDEECLGFFGSKEAGVDGWIILGWISRRWDVGIWTEFGWPRIEMGGGGL